MSKSAKATTPKQERSKPRLFLLSPKDFTPHGLAKFFAALTSKEATPALAEEFRQLMKQHGVYDEVNDRFDLVKAAKVRRRQLRGEKTRLRNAQQERKPTTTLKASTRRSRS